MNTLGAHLDGEMIKQLQRRREARISCVKPVYVRPCVGMLENKFVYSKMLDCSPRGLCLLAPTRMEPREQFLLKLRFERLMLVLYTVRHCAEGDYANWRIGAEFSGIVGVSPIHAPEVVFETLLSLPDQPVPKPLPRQRT